MWIINKPGRKQVLDMQYGEQTAHMLGTIYLTPCRFNSTRLRRSLSGVFSLKSQIWGKLLLEGKEIRRP